MRSQRSRTRGLPDNAPQNANAWRVGEELRRCLRIRYNHTAHGLIKTLDRRHATRDARDARIQRNRIERVGEPSAGSLDDKDFPDIAFPELNAACACYSTIRRDITFDSLPIRATAEIAGINERLSAAVSDPQ